MVELKKLIPSQSDGYCLTFDRLNPEDFSCILAEVKVHQSPIFSVVAIWHMGVFYRKSIVEVRKQLTAKFGWSWSQILRVTIWGGLCEYCISVKRTYMREKEYLPKFITRSFQPMPKCNETMRISFLYDMWWMKTCFKLHGHLNVIL